MSVGVCHRDPRLLTQDLAFPVQYGQLGSSNIEATGSHSTLSSHSSDEVLSSTVATQTLEVDSSGGPFCHPTHASAHAQILTSIMLQHCGRAGATQTVAMCRAAEVV